MNISTVSGPKISCGCIKTCFMLFMYCYLFDIFHVVYFKTKIWRACIANSFDVLQSSQCVFIFVVVHMHASSYRTSQRQRLLILFCVSKKLWRMFILFLICATCIFYLAKFLEEKHQRWHAYFISFRKQFPPKKIFCLSSSQEKRTIFFVLCAYFLYG